MNRQGLKLVNVLSTEKSVGSIPIIPQVVNNTILEPIKTWVLKEPSHVLFSFFFFFFCCFGVPILSASPSPFSRGSLLVPLCFSLSTMSTF